MYQATVDYKVSDAIWKVVMNHNKGNPVSRSQLVQAVARLGFPTHERQIRENIKQMRRDGYLILSMPGEGGGYYASRSRAEYEEFMQMEFNAKITDMLETKRAMDRSANQAYGLNLQQSLF